MIAQQIGIVICRVAAAILIVQTIRAFGFVVPALFTSPDTIVSSLLGFAALGLIPGLIAVALWFYAERIVGVPREGAGAPHDVKIDETELVRAGTLLIGLYLVITGTVLGLSVEMTDLIMPEWPNMESASRRYATQRLSTRVTYVLEILFGVVLMFGRHQLAQFATRLRRAGTGV